MVKSIKKKTDRTGERRKMNCGMCAEIIEYKHCRDITIKFDDGTILEHKRYEFFVKGELENHNFNKKAS